MKLSLVAFCGHKKRSQAKWNKAKRKINLIGYSFKNKSSESLSLTPILLVQKMVLTFKLARAGEDEVVDEICKAKSKSKMDGSSRILRWSC